jgi:hypothetical protein
MNRALTSASAARFYVVGTQVTSIGALAPLAIPLPCPMYRKRNPIVLLGVETNP